MPGGLSASPWHRARARTYNHGSAAVKSMEASRKSVPFWSMIVGMIVGSIKRKRPPLLLKYNNHANNHAPETYVFATGFHRFTCISPMIVGAERPLYHLHVTLGNASRNHLTEGCVIELGWLLYPVTCHHLWGRLRHDQSVDILTLKSATSLYWTTEWHDWWRRWWLWWCCCCCGRHGANQI